MQINSSHLSFQQLKNDNDKDASCEYLVFNKHQMFYACSWINSLGREKALL